MSPELKTSRTQKERRDQTRGVILDATVDCLLELGFARTTTAEVQRRAGVSRGALLHHFPSKAGLLGASVSHLAAMRGAEIKDSAARLPAGGARVDAVIDLLWGSFSGPLFAVAAELRNAARTDAELREVLAAAEVEIRERILFQSRCLFGAEIAGRAGFEAALDLTLQLMIGASMTAVLHEEPAQVEKLIARWKQIFPAILELPNTDQETAT